MSFSGVGLQDGKVTWTIRKQPFWLRSYMMNPYDYTTEQVANGTVDVDKEGNFQIRFTPERGSQLDKPVFRSYRVEATLTDGKGETQATEYTFSVGDAGIVLSIEMANQLEKDEAQAVVKAQTVNGEPVNTQGTYTIFRMQGEENPASAAELELSAGTLG